MSHSTQAPRVLGSAYHVWHRPVLGTTLYFLLCLHVSNSMEALEAHSVNQTHSTESVGTPQDAGKNLKYAGRGRVMPDETKADLHKTRPHDNKPRDTVLYQTVPHETDPDETVSQETVPHESVSHESIPPESVPHESVPPESVPHESVPHESVLHKTDRHETRSANKRTKTSVTEQGPSTVTSRQPTTLTSRQPTTLTSRQPTTLTSRQPTTLTSRQPTTLTSRQPTTLTSRQPTTLTSRQPTTLTSRQPTTLTSRQPTTLTSRQPTTLTSQDSAAGGEFEEHKLFISNCSSLHEPTVVGRKGSMSGLYVEGVVRFTSADISKCTWSIHIPPQYRFMHLLVTITEDPCLETYVIRTGTSPTMLSGPVPAGEVWQIPCRYHFRQIFVESRQYHFFIYETSFNSRSKLPRFTVGFEAYNEDVRKQLQVTFDSPTSGYITSWGFDWRKNCLCVNNASYHLQTPAGHVVMLSFARFDIHETWSDCPDAGLWLFSVQRKTLSLIFHKCGPTVLPTDIYHTPVFLKFQTQLYCNFGGTGFKALFSFLPRSQQPERFANALFNCSTLLYPSFKDHVNCNLEYECERGEDEGEHCPYSSPDCRGLVSSGNKCYEYLGFRYPISSYAAQSECSKRNGDLAMMKTKSEWEDLKKVYQYGKRYPMALIGVRSGDFLFPDMYKYSLKWMDNTIAHNIHVLSLAEMQVSYHKEYEMCGILQFEQTFSVSFQRCIYELYSSFLCQVIVRELAKASVTFPFTTFPLSETGSRTGQWLTACVKGHVTHAFLSCDPGSQCLLDDQHLPECRLANSTSGTGPFAVSTFQCEGSSSETVPYTLVCDFRPDCKDGSDETFCVHEETCHGYRCGNGQCVNKAKRCDLQRDCLDQSDELGCEDIVHPMFTRFVFPPIQRLPPPVSIDYDSGYRITQTALQHGQPCSNTHFRCPEHYCLPVYLRCNGVKDCPAGDDEADCHLHTCPGFYRCWSSRVCVHADHLCDGWPQCPLRDDEWLCRTDCPDQCSCQGHAFRCPQTVFLTPYPHLRYLDAGGSGLGVGDVTGLVYLVWLSLARCGVREVLPMNLPNLRTLHLSRNRLTALNMDVFASLSNLKTLTLSRNPLVCLSAMNGSARHDVLRTLDLSLISLHVFSCDMISAYSRVTHLNLSFSQVHTIRGCGFSSAPLLRTVDLRGNLLKSYPLGLLQHLRELQSVLTDDYRLCCHQSLPDAFFHRDGECVSPQTPLSSCEDLLRSAQHRAALLVITILGVLGNSVCLVSKVCVVRSAFASPTAVVMTNLWLMDLLMAGYAMVIVVADWTFRHHYLSVRRVWTASAACQAAGLVASVSYQATGLALCFLTLCGVLSTCRHGQGVSVTRRGAVVACVMIWSLAILISSVPAVLPHWRYHGHTDGCVSVPSRIRSADGRAYGLAVMVVLHLVVSSLTAVGQTLVRWARYFHADAGGLFLSTEWSHRMSEASRPFPIVGLDCVRRVAFCVPAVMDHAGLAVPDGMHAVMAIVLLPSTCAANPALYAVSALLARRRRAAEQRLLQRLHRKLALQKKTGPGGTGLSRGVASD